MKWMIKNSDGKEDAMLTFSVVGFTVVVVKFLLSGVTLKLVGLGYDISFGSVDAAAIAAILTPTLVTYAARRNTDKKYISQKVSK
jgi:putative flippase GtrA